MATDVGTNIVEDDLIFGFDSGYGVADNSTATRFYPGEPTVNYVSDSPSQGGWSGGIDVLDSSQKKFKCHISNFNGSPGAGWRSFTWNMNDHSGDDVTISLDFETVGPNGTMAWIMVGQTNTHTNNNSGAGQYMGYSAASERTQKSTTSKERVTWTGTIGSTGTASQPSGHIGFTIWINNGVPGNQDAYVIVSNVQIEKKDHATPFVNGTRSATNSLIDLEKTTSVDLSNASFDSTGQPTLDGTDDLITISGSSYITSDVKTVEIVFKMNGSFSNFSPLAVYANGSSSTNRIWLGLQSISGAYKFQMHGWGTDDPSGQTTISADEWYVCAFSYNKGTQAMKIYTNGVLEASITNSQGGVSALSSLNWYIGTVPGGWQNVTYSNVDVSIFKIYNRVLSDSEVKQNYNAYKNRFNI
jgi:hypothetical protein